MIAKRFPRWSHYLLLAVLLLPLLSGCTQSKNIVNDLEEREANEILVFLDRQGIAAEKIAAPAAQGGGGDAVPLYSISVHPNQATEAMAFLNANGLPRRKTPSLLGLFSQGGLVPSELEQKVKYQEGLAEQMAGTIRRIDGVIDAVVQLSFPEEDILPNPDAVKKEKTASVYVKHQGVLDDPNSQLVTKIRRMVSSSIEGLKYENVTVIADRARFIADPTGAGGIGGQIGDEPDYVRLWGVILAKESIGYFRTLIFAFAGAALFFLVFTLWTIFKVYPILARAGGVTTLLSLKPILSSDLAEAKKKKKMEPGEKDEELEEDDEELSVEAEAAEKEAEEEEQTRE